MFVHDQELDDSFLDDLFVSILYKIPELHWIDITKNKNQVVAGIKHLIDMDVYSSGISLILDNDHQRFRKINKFTKPVDVYAGKWINSKADFNAGVSSYELDLMFPKPKKQRRGKRR